MNIFTRLLALFVTLILAGCGGASDTSKEIDEVQEQSRFGGVFKMPVTSYFKAIRVNEIQKHEDAQIYGQIYEGLVRYNTKTLEVEPSLCTEWKTLEDGKTYVFKLRDSVYFHDNSCFQEGKGRKMVPEDVVYSITQIFEPKENNSSYSLFRNTVVGGDEYYAGKDTVVSGVSIQDGDIRIDLTRPSLSFLKKIASIFGAIVPKEANESEEPLLVGTGPFVYDEGNSTSEKVQLIRNQNYHGLDEKRNQLPYLDSVQFIYYENVDEKMELFWNGELTYLPQVAVSKISEVLEERISDFESKPPKYILNSEPQLTVSYVEMNTQKPIFRKKEVRQAINMAINRKKLVEKIMKNQAYEIGKFGVTPPLSKVFNGYDFEGIEDVSYSYNPQRAKELLAEAGYPDGKNFPSLSMQFVTGRTSYLIVSEIQSQLRSVLNINVDIEALGFDDLLANTVQGKADLIRTTWTADFPSPESFLGNAYGKFVPKRGELSYINTSRYKNPKFDEAFEKGRAAMDENEANEYFAQAEKILMEDPPFIVLWYDEDMALKQANIQEFNLNGMGYLNLREVYFQEPKVSDYEN